MATNTTRGITYPTSGDSIAPLESHFALIAESTDTAIGVTEGLINDVDSDLQAFKLEVGLAPQGGVFGGFSGPTSTSVPVNITVNLPSGYFSSAPIVTATVAGATTAAGYFAVLHSVTSSQFQARIWRMSGTAGETLTLNWIALA
jgi:hypothetical protein